jgi:hypothetical protein
MCRPSDRRSTHFDPAGKSCAALTSTSYRAAPGTGSQENCGSTTRASVARLISRGVVVDGQTQSNEATRERAPLIPSASVGVIAQ